MRAIVLDALGKQVGETLVKNVDLRGELGVGVGTVQRALDLLADRGALQTVSCGHMGRRIEAVDLGQCWQAAGLSPVRVLMPPPGSVEIDSPAHAHPGGGMIERYQTGIIESWR